MPFPKETTKRLGRARGWKCDHCGKLWAEGWILEGHHRIPTHMGGTDADSNFALLCQYCHMIAHQDLARADFNSARLIQARYERTEGKWK